MEPEALHQQQCRTRWLPGQEADRPIWRTPPRSWCSARTSRCREAIWSICASHCPRTARVSCCGCRRPVPGHPPGSVEVADERMMVGYVRRLAERDTVPDLDFASWMQVLRRAHAISLACARGPVAASGGRSAGADGTDLWARRERGATPRPRLVRAGGRIPVGGRRAQPDHRRCPWRGGRILAGNGCHTLYQAAVAAAAAVGRADRRDAGA